MQIVENLVSFLNGRSNIRFLPFIHSKDNFEVYYEHIFKVGAIIDHDLNNIYIHPSNYVICRLNLYGNIGNFVLNQNHLNIYLILILNLILLIIYFLSQIEKLI